MNEKFHLKFISFEKKGKENIYQKVLRCIV